VLKGRHELILSLGSAPKITPAQWGGALARASDGARPPEAHVFLRDARHAKNIGQFRRSVLDSATAAVARPPEFGPPCLRVLPARDNGQRRTEAGEEAKAQPRADHPQAAHRRADALGGQDDRRSCEGPGGLRADPAPLAKPVRRHEGGRRQAAEGAGARERPAEAPGRRQGARKPCPEGDLAKGNF
jgi:hypothetical protein